ncbi:MAG: tyrosine-type recombinase/integrase [bacterium]
MSLVECIDAYVALKRSLGMRFRSEAELLRAFSRTIGPLDLAAVTPDAVRAFIAGSGPVTAFWRQKWVILRGFYRFALSRGFATASPVPVTLPQLPPPLTPYIYSSEELTRLLAATDTLQEPRSPLRTLTFRTLLLLLYGTGMRIGEALSLTLPDIDVGQRLVTIRDAKFFKSRLVPTGPQLTHALAVYVTQRRHLPLPAGEASTVFATRTGQALCYDVVNLLFRRVRRRAGIRREAGARYQPRLHDLRHTAAVHRLIAWYRAGADVQRLLPHLATYLGHVDIASTQRYLTMTPELLREASHRFEQYAQPEASHE